MPKEKDNKNKPKEHKKEEKGVTQSVDRFISNVIKEVKKITAGPPPKKPKKVCEVDNKQVYFLAHGKHKLIIDPKRPLRGIKIRELENVVAICGGGNNILNWEIDRHRDKLILDCDIRTNLAVIEITLDF